MVQFLNDSFKESLKSSTFQQTGSYKTYDVRYFFQGPRKKMAPTRNKPGNYEAQKICHQSRPPIHRDFPHFFRVPERSRKIAERRRRPVVNLAAWEIEIGGRFLGPQNFRVCSGWVSFFSGHPEKSNGRPKFYNGHFLKKWTTVATYRTIS